MPVVQAQVKPTIGIFSTGQGHRSIAQAVQDKLTDLAGDLYQSKIFYTQMPINGDKEGSLYNYLYRLAPKAYQVPFKLSAKAIESNPELKKLSSIYFRSQTQRSTEKFIKEQHIKLSISTYFLFQPVLADANLKQGIPYINIIHDPRTIHPWQLAKEARSNLFFDDHKIKYYQTKCQAKVAGWFVRDQYEADYNQAEVRKRLKLQEQLTILVVSGSDGSTAVLKILPALINCQRPTQVLIACGRNQSLYDNVRGIRKSLSKFSQSQATIIPLKFTKKLHLYMQAADLVVGKAGPNTLFESIATLTPFFATVHMPQEAGNLNIIKQYHLGYVEENGKQASRQLLDIINQPKQLTAFKADLLKMKQHNQQAGKILLEEIAQALK